MSWFDRKPHLYFPLLFGGVAIFLGTVFSYYGRNPPLQASCVVDSSTISMREGYKQVTLQLNKTVTNGTGWLTLANDSEQYWFGLCYLENDKQPKTTSILKISIPIDKELIFPIRVVIHREMDEIEIIK